MEKLMGIYAIASHLFVIPHKNECMKFFQKQKRISKKKGKV